MRPYSAHVDLGPSSDSVPGAFGPCRLLQCMMQAAKKG
jgi:hypothetical protein